MRLLNSLHTASNAPIKVRVDVDDRSEVAMYVIRDFELVNST